MLKQRTLKWMKKHQLLDSSLRDLEITGMGAATGASQTSLIFMQHKGYLLCRKFFLAMHSSCPEMYTVFCFGKPVVSDCIHILVQPFLGLASYLHLVGTGWISHHLLQMKCTSILV